MAKMVDVAEKAGVSIKTVSRVLNNEPHVKDELRQRVRRAAQEVGYVPSTTARQLRGRRSYSIHMVTHSDRSNYTNAVQSGALKACQARGYQLMISMLSDIEMLSEEQIHAHFAQLMKSRKPDALILVPPLSNSESLGEILAEFDVRVGRVGPHDLPSSSVTVRIDERAAAQALTEYLIEHGHRKIAFQRGKDDQNATKERLAGYRDALSAARIEFDPDLVFHGDFNFTSGLEAGDLILSRADRPSAVFAANDDMAAGIIMAAHRRNLPMPETLSVVGFDDSAIARRTWPALTTVRQPPSDYGEVAALKLIESLSQPDLHANDVVVLDFDFVERDSVITLT